MAVHRQNSALLVLGMHRSGTSALTGVLSMAGANPGPSLIPGMEGVNPKGFWEHREVVIIHERLLATLNSSWDDERPLPDCWWHLPEVAGFRDELVAVLRSHFSTSPLWVLKDPRLCRLLPLWLEILLQLEVRPHFIICLRHPGEVAKSLEQRDGIRPERACLLWLESLIESKRWTTGYARAIVDYAELLTDWRMTLRNVAMKLSIAFPLDEAAADKIDIFLEPALRHHCHEQMESLGNNSLFTLAVSAFMMAIREEVDLCSERFLSIEDETDRVVRLVVPWAEDVCALRKKNEMLDARASRVEATNALLQTEIARIKTTVSWKITKPLRLLFFIWCALNKKFRKP